jgi:hypothetical protein
VRRCLFPECPASTDSWFYLLPEGGQVTAWPMSIPYLAEPLPLCDRHGALIGEGKRRRPARPTLDWLPDVVRLFQGDQGWPR